jgi:hypothetical protein
VILFNPSLATAAIHKHKTIRAVDDDAKRLQLDERTFWMPAFIWYLNLNIFYIVQKSFIKLSLTRPSPSNAAKSSNFATEQNRCPILIGRPYDKQGLWVGLYNPAFDEFRDRLRTKIDITPDDLARISSFCTAAVAIYGNEKERRKAMQDTLAKILRAAVMGVLASNDANSDGSIVTIIHELPLYRGILEWKNDMGEGGCDAVKQGCFSFRNYWTQNKVRNPVRCLSGSHFHYL